MLPGFVATQGNHRLGDGGCMRLFDGSNGARPPCAVPACAAENDCDVAGHHPLGMSQNTTRFGMRGRPYDHNVAFRNRTARTVEQTTYARHTRFYVYVSRMCQYDLLIIIKHFALLDFSENNSVQQHISHQCYIKI